MRYNNAFKDKANLRREQLNRKQYRNSFKSKSLSSGRIIERRIKSITADNIENEINRLACMVKIDDLVGLILYHIRFGMDVYPTTFHEDSIIEILETLKKFRIEFDAGNINAEQYIEQLENVDKQISNKLNNTSRY